MDQERLNLLIQGATLLSVVVGLALVIWELGQSRELLRAELTADALAQVNAQHIGLMGDDAAEAIARACDEPSSLTTKDMIILAGYYGGLENRLRRLYQIERRTDQYVAGDQWQHFAPGVFGLIFATEYGRWWWKNLRPAPPEIQEEGERVLANLGEPMCSTLLARYRSSLGSIEEERGGP